MVPILNIMLYAVPYAFVSSYVTVKKEETQRKNFSQVGNKTEQFL